MNAYVDSSVLLRFILGETDRLASWSRVTRPVSSELIRVECLRTIDRARLLLHLDDDAVAERRASALELIDSLELVPVSAAILARAADPFPTALGSLDAIHLATALAIRETLAPLTLATHDHELAAAARSVGVTVEGV